MASKRVLMVEGPDDAYVVKHICGERQLGKIETIHPYGGKAPLLEGLGTRLKESDVIALGILLDADADLLACWQSVTDRLKQAGYTNIAALPSSDGTVIAAPKHSLLPRIGIWLMPDNQVNGILEDFLRFLVPMNDPLFAHVLQSLDTIAPAQRRFSDLKQPKARIHTWLAWQEEPGKPYGQAISARYLDPHLPAADIFAGWLQRTFFSP